MNIVRELLAYQNHLNIYKNFGFSNCDNSTFHSLIIWYIQLELKYKKEILNFTRTTKVEILDKGSKFFFAEQIDSKLKEINEPYIRYIILHFIRISLEELGRDINIKSDNFENNFFVNYPVETEKTTPASHINLMLYTMYPRIINENKSIHDSILNEICLNIKEIKCIDFNYVFVNDKLEVNQSLEKEIRRTPKINKTERRDELFELLVGEYIEDNKIKFNRLFSGSELKSFDKINWKNTNGSLKYFLQEEIQKQTSINYLDIAEYCFSLKNKPINRKKFSGNTEPSEKDQSKINSIIAALSDPYY
jgi:hypothetical protein